MEHTEAPLAIARILISTFTVIILGFTGTSCDPPCSEKNTPVIHSFVAAPQAVALGETAVVTLTATDPHGSALTYIWSSTGGDLLSQTGKSIAGQPVPYTTVIFEPPDYTGDVTVTVIVKNDSCSTDQTLVVPVQASGETSDTDENELAEQAETTPTFTPIVIPSATPTPEKHITITDTCASLIDKGQETDAGELETVLDGTSFGIQSTSMRVYIIVDPVKDGYEWVQGPPVGYLDQNDWSGVIRLGGIDTFNIRAIATEKTIEPGQYDPDELPKTFNDPTLLTSNILKCDR
jgi:hypothetical protein